MKVVLDTNVLISGLLWLGKPNRLLKEIEGGNLTLCSSKHLAAEKVSNRSLRRHPGESRGPVHQRCSRFRLSPE